MKTKRRNRVETQSGNEESEEWGAGKGRRGDRERGRQGENIPCPLVPSSPCLPVSGAFPSPSSHTLRPTHSLTLCLRATAALSRSKASVDGEAEFESGAHAHRLPVLNRRLKEYFLGRLDGGLGQSVRQPAHHADVVDTPVCAEDDSQHDRALDFVQTGLFGVFGFFTMEDCRFQCFGHDGNTAARASSGTTTGAKFSPADAAKIARPIARAFTLPDSGPGAGAA